MIPQEPERIWHYYIDAEGHLWHDGAEFDDPTVLNLFMKKMELLPERLVKPGSRECFHVICQGEDCLITPEDVPYVVQDLEISPKEIRLRFPGGYAESLDPSTLFVGDRNVLYCKVRGGKFTARFNRKSYHDLAKVIEYDSKARNFYLTVDNQRYPITGVAAG